jgi:hypothetical protein
MLKNKKIYIVIILVFLSSGYLFGQDFPGVDSLLKINISDSEKLVLSKDYPENWKKVENVVFIGTNLILTTPDDNTIDRRNEMMGFVIEWSEKGKYNLPSNDNLGQKFMEIENSLWAYYVICLSKCYLQNRNPELSNNELKLKAIELLIYYISDTNHITDNGELNYSSVKQSDFLNEMIGAKKANKLKEYLNL